MVFDKSATDYSLYLVTNNEMVPEGLTIYDQVLKSLENGATIVQLREKDLETKEFISRAAMIHELTLKFNVPLIINDRVDVALAIDAEGVHVGQDDMDFEQVRKMIGPDKIIGVSCSRDSEVLEVVKSKSNIDYIGIGPVYETNTKKLTKVPFGTTGIRSALRVLRDNDASHIKSVIIGGLNKSNIQRVLYTSSIPGKATDGVAVVSCIMAQEDAALATRETLASIKKVGPWVKKNSGSDGDLYTSIENITKHKPMVHHITNGVVKNFSANVTIAIGASPIMSELDEEFEEFAQFPKTALLLNTGTPTDDQIKMYVHAIDLYNKFGTPIVYDPVGCGASFARKSCLRKLLNQSYFTVIKGNAGEILTAAGVESQMKGVDSESVESNKVLLDAAIKLATEQRCVVVATGERDIIVDGSLTPFDVAISSQDIKIRHCIVSGGHEFMGLITGSGCSLGSVIAASVASNPGDVFKQVVAAVLLYNEAGSNAAKLAQGPGTFMIHFLDELYKVLKSKDLRDTKVEFA